MDVVRMQSGEEDFELKQMRDMAAAKKRWDAMVRINSNYATAYQKNSHIFVLFL